MKTLIVILAITLTTSAYAGTCENLTEVSGAIMTARQSGTPMADIWNIKTTKRLSEYGHAKMKEAYSIPRYETQEYQQKEIEDFKNDAFLECVQVLDK